MIPIVATMRTRAADRDNNATSTIDNNQREEVEYTPSESVNAFFARLLRRGSEQRQASASSTTRGGPPTTAGPRQVAATARALQAAFFLFRGHFTRSFQLPRP